MVHADSHSESLLRRAAEGDGAARAELLDRYRDRLRKAIVMRLDKRLAARIDASDIVQDAMKDAFRRLPEYFAEPQISFYPWLRRIAWDRLADMHRTHVVAEKRSVLREQPWTPQLSDESVDELAHSIVTSSVNPGRRAMLAEMEGRIKAALLQLKPDDREILVMRFLEQLSVEEIAGVLATTVPRRFNKIIADPKRAARYVSSDPKQYDRTVH